MSRIRIATAITISALLVAGCGVSYDADLLASLEGR